MDTHACVSRLARIQNVCSPQKKNVCNKTWTVQLCTKVCQYWRLNRINSTWQTWSYLPCVHPPTFHCLRTSAPRLSTLEPPSSGTLPPRTWIQPPAPTTKVITIYLNTTHTSGTVKVQIYSEQPVKVCVSLQQHSLSFWHQSDDETESGWSSSSFRATRRGQIIHGRSHTTTFRALHEKPVNTLRNKTWPSALLIASLEGASVLSESVRAFQMTNLCCSRRWSHCRKAWPQKQRRVSVNQRFWSRPACSEASVDNRGAELHHNDTSSNFTVTFQLTYCEK